MVKILHILSDGPTDLSTEIIGVQSAENEVKVIDLSAGEANYASIIDEIAASDRVVSW